MPIHGLDERSLFRGLRISEETKPKRFRIMQFSLVVHAVAVALLVLIPILWPSPLPEHPDAIRALLYDPPPPPPAPLPKGSVGAKKSEPVHPVTRTKPDETKLTTPDQKPKEEPLKPEAPKPTAGVENGSDIGTPEGMEGGVEGGQVGGVPGGVLGGMIGGTGDVVMDYDQAPKFIHEVRPTYPNDAFIKKIEGTVEVEFIIDVDGRVRRARIVRSVYMLDDAALRTVLAWVFTPAIKNGRPVATMARAPVVFRIY